MTSNNITTKTPKQQKSIAKDTPETKRFFQRHLAQTMDSSRGTWHKNLSFKYTIPFHRITTSAPDKNEPKNDISKTNHN